MRRLRCGIVALLVTMACSTATMPPQTDQPATPASATSAVVGATSCGATSRGPLVTGPAAAEPGRELRFALIDGARRLTVDEWTQVRHTEHYVGDEYLSSSALLLAPASDGTVAVTASSPGRYRLGAKVGAETFEGCVLVRPGHVTPVIRGSAFRTPVGPIGTKPGPLDRSAAREALRQASQHGMTWAELDPAAYADFDTDSVAIHQYCEWCYGSITVEDFDWLIDEAHRQGLSVAITTGVWARWQGEMYELWNVLTGNLIGGTPAPSSRMRSAQLPVPSDERIQPEILGAYRHYFDDLAAVAAKHNVEALMLSAGGTLGQLWKQTEGWHALIAQLRREFSGAVWVEGAETCGFRGPSGATIVGLSYLYPDVEGMLSSLSDLLQTVARTPRCPAFGEYAQAPARPSPLTADTLAQRLGPELDGLDPFKLQATNGKMLVFTDLYTCNLEGVSYLGPTVCGSNAVRNDQEIVDTFEGLMKTVGQRPNVAMFLWTISLAPDPASARSDPMQHPALAAAIANWWGR